jgi:hypothetical protein
MSDDTVKGDHLLRPLSVLVDGDDTPYMTQE